MEAGFVFCRRYRFLVLFQARTRHGHSRPGRPTDDTRDVANKVNFDSDIEL